MRHILVAHEDPGCSKSLWRLLRRNDLKASIADSCKQALDQLKSSYDSSEQIDLVITSFHKSRFNDGSLLHALKQEAIDIPVIVLTSYLDNHHLNQVTPGNSVVINEPVEEKDIIDNLERVLSYT